MIKRVHALLCSLAIILSLVACGTLEVEVEETAVVPSSTLEPTSVVADMTRPATEVAEEPSPPVPTSVVTEETEEALPTQSATEQTNQESEVSAPAGWQRFSSEEFGLSLAIPPGYTVEVREPSTPVTWNERIPEGVEEKQLFVAGVLQEISAGIEGAGPAQVLEIKVVANPEGFRLGRMADLFSLRCPGELTEPVSQTTLAPQLQGYRYTCQGMLLFTEFWAPYGDSSDLIFGAAWGEQFSPLAEDILATLSIDPK